MNKDTLKILVAVLRLFTGAAGKRNPITLHEHEIVNQVCRSLHKRKEKEIKNTKGLIVFSVRSLKGGRILYEAVDSWSDDKLKRPKAAAVRRLFGLTDRAIKYIEESTLVGLSSTSDQFLLDMMRAGEFGVLPKERANLPFATVPAVLVEAVAEITQEQILHTQEPVQTMTVSNNAARIAAEIKKLNYPSQFFTPAKLLGGLNQVKAFSPETAAMSITIGWAPNRVKHCRQALEDRGLIAWRDVSDINFETKTHAVKHTGMFLTPLGREVAEAGGFVNDIPEERRWTRKSRREQRLMLKGSKKQAALATPTVATGNCVMQLPNGTTVQFTSTQEAVAFMSALNAAGGGTPIPAETQLAATSGSVAVAAPPVRRPKRLGNYRTIAVLLKAVTNTICSTVASLETIDGSEEINVDGVSLGLTEIGHMLKGFKHYVNKCVSDDTIIDVKSLQDYAAQMELDLERLEKDQRIPVLGDIEADMGYGRVLRGEKSIKKVVWTP